MPALGTVARDMRQGKDGIFLSGTVEHDKKVVALALVCSAALEEKGQGMAFSRPVLLARGE